MIKRAMYFYLRLKLWVEDILACLAPSTYGGSHSDSSEMMNQSFFFITFSFARRLANVDLGTIFMA